MSSSKSIGLQQAGGEGAGCRTFPMGTSHFMAVMNPSIPSRIKGEEITLSWDEQPTKVRKPYTITKQRERWTEEEHQKFLESLKLYGRTWRRIEEHIGTKSAVQIRSHAQKFFSKLGREPSTSGLLTWGAQDIEIPPPRPKRKPSHPYPRKACSTVSSSPSIEEDTISPSAVCSSSNSFESLKYRLQTSPLKNAMCTLSSNQGSLLTLDTSNISRASIGSSPKVGSPTSLKLFGQTLTISVAQSADVSAADQVHLDSVKTVGEPSIKSSSVDSESRGSLASEREVEFSMPCLSSFTNDIEASCGDSRVNVEKSTLHSTEVPSKENDQAQKWKLEAGTGYHRATLKENIIHQVFPGDNEGQQVEDQSCLDEQNISIITDPEIHTFAPGVNSSVPLHRFPSLPSGVSSNHQEEGQMGLVSHSPFQHPIYGTFESLAWFECWAAKNCIGNSFTSLELAAQQNLATSATAFWPGFVHSASDQYETEDDASTGAAVAAASFAAASAYWSLLREVQSGIYPKIAVVTAPARLTSNGPTCMFESVAKVKEQELNHRTAFDRKTENPDHKHECGVNIMTHDKETVGSKVNSIETHISKAKFPAERCHSGPEFLGGCLISDTSSWDADSKLPKKRLGSSYSVEYGARKKGSKGVSNEALTQFHTSVGVSESRDENINCTSGTDIGCVQTNRNGNVAKKWQVKSPLASQDLQRNIGHSASNDIGSFDETLCEVASSEREEKVKNVLEQKDISDTWQNQQGNSRQVGTMATKQCQLLDAGDQEFHKLFRAEAVENVTAFQSQVTSVPLSMVETKEMASLSSPDNVTNLLHDEVVMLIPLAKSVAKDGQLCSTSEVDNNLKETFRRGLKPAVVSETKVRFSLEKDYEGEFRNPKTETGSVKTSCAIKHPKMFLGTEDCGNTELLPSERCDVVKAERDEDLLSGLKIRGGIGSSRYSGVGFVPYKKSL